MLTLKGRPPTSHIQTLIVQVWSEAQERSFLINTPNRLKQIAEQLYLRNAERVTNHILPPRVFLSIFTSWLRIISTWKGVLCPSRALGQTYAPQRGSLLSALLDAPCMNILSRVGASSSTPDWTKWFWIASLWRQQGSNYCGYRLHT